MSDVYGGQKFQFANGESVENSGTRQTLVYALQHPPVAGTLQGSLYVGDDLVQTFTVSPSGEFAFTQVGSPRAFAEGGTITESAGRIELDWSRVPGPNRMVVDYEYAICSDPQPAAHGDLGMDDYQRQAAATAVYPGEVSLIYPILGMAGEVGEFCEKAVQAFWPKGADCQLGSEIAFTLLEVSRVCAVAEKLKKRLRDQSADIPPADLEKLKASREAANTDEMVPELGDQSWYLSAVARDMGMKLSDVARKNLSKLQSRQKRGKLQGSGDNR